MWGAFFYTLARRRTLLMSWNKMAAEDDDVASFQSPAPDALDLLKIKWNGQLNILEFAAQHPSFLVLRPNKLCCKLLEEFFCFFTFLNELGTKTCSITWPRRPSFANFFSFVLRFEAKVRSHKDLPNEAALGAFDRTKGRDMWRKMTEKNQSWRSSSHLLLE